MNYDLETMLNIYDDTTFWFDIRAAAIEIFLHINNDKQWWEEELVKIKSDEEQDKFAAVLLQVWNNTCCETTQLFVAHQLLCLVHVTNSYRTDSHALKLIQAVYLELLTLSVEREIGIELDKFASEIIVKLLLQIEHVDKPVIEEAALN